MVKTILIWLGIGVAVAFLILWIVSGGLSRIISQAKLFTNPFTDGLSGGTFLRLPWQPENLSLSVTSGNGGASTSEDPEEELRALQEEYKDLDAAVREAREFGTPSPYRDQVHIDKGTATRTSVDEEYIRISAASGNTSPTDITGWSLQSVLTGVRAYIPRGTEVFLMGTVNVQKNIQLEGGGSAIATSGQSPLGTSIRENLCTGYLNQLQTFYPKLKERCPDPAEVLPLTADNLRIYGDTCVDFVKTISSCKAPIQSFTPELSIACRNYLADTLSYNGCALRYHYSSGFEDRTWRVYLNASKELWRNTHDVIRLLDAEGRTVDAITY